MSERADITSVEAIASFRTALLVYASKVRPLLDDATDEVYRAREWVRVTQRLHWENRVRENRRALTDAQQALFSAELARLREPTSAETIAVHQAKRALSLAEEGLERLKKLANVVEKEAQPRLKHIEQLRGMMAIDLPEAARHLERILATLDAYHAAMSARPGEETSS